MDFVNLINTLGFPIACVCACGWFITRLWNQQTKDKDRLYIELEKANAATTKAIETIRIYAEKLDIIQDDVKVIKDKVVG